MDRRAVLLVVLGLAACTPLRPLEVDTGDAGGRTDSAAPIDSSARVDSCVASGPELCNGVDDDCDATTDDGSADPSISMPCDGADTDECEEGTYTGCVDGVLVCDDATTDTLETCDLLGVDEDCDGMSDESTAVGATTFYPDVDQDGFGDDDGAVMACRAPMDGRWVDRGGDCDDTDRDVRPGRVERCNAQDDDCDGMRDEGTPCLDTCTTRERGGSVYQFCRTQGDWNDTSAYCAASGYHLVKIDDAMENEFVTSESMALGLGGVFANGSVWIGLRQSMSGAPHLWEDGTMATYAAWDMGEPDGTGPCVRTRVSDGGLWADLGCGIGAHFVCEAP